MQAQRVEGELLRTVLYMDLHKQKPAVALDFSDTLAVPGTGGVVLNSFGLLRIHRSRVPRPPQEDLRCGWVSRREPHRHREPLPLQENGSCCCLDPQN